MRLVRFGLPGQELPGILDAQGQIRDLSGIVDDIDAAALAPSSLEKLRGIDIERLPLVPAGTRLGPCVGSVPNRRCSTGASHTEVSASSTPHPKKVQPMPMIE